MYVAFSEYVNFKNTSWLHSKKNQIGIYFFSHELNSYAQIVVAN